MTKIGLADARIQTIIDISIKNSFKKILLHRFYHIFREISTFLYQFILNFNNRKFVGYNFKKRTQNKRASDFFLRIELYQKNLHHFCRLFNMSEKFKKSSEKMPKINWRKNLF